MATDDAIETRYQLFARLRDAGFGMLAWCVVTAGLRTMPDDEYADLTAEVERIATPRPTADLVALVREIADRDPEYDTGEGYIICHYCDGDMKSRGKGKQQEFFVEHEQSCLWVRARAIVARLDANGKEE